MEKAQGGDYGTYLAITQQEESNESKATPLDNDIKENVWKYRACMFLCGLINNTGYVMVGTAAQSIAKHFKMESFMSAFNFSLIFLSIGVVALNANLLIKVKHQTRVYSMLVLSVVGFIIIGACTEIDEKWAFFVALLGATICGCMQGFGEATMLGYCKSFSSQLIGLWSSGTGFAGIFGSGLYLVLVAMKIKELFIFLLLIPCLLIYLFSFKWLESKRRTFGVALQTNAVQVDDTSANGSLIENSDNSTNNLSMNLANVKYVLSLAWTYTLNLGLVYFFEYLCLTSWADRATLTSKQEAGFFNENVLTMILQAFAVLSFSYQIGVFASRSSLEVIKIKQVWILTVIQGVNCILWAAIAVGKYYEQFTITIGLQISFMVWVGLMGGGSYVNINYQIVSESVLPANGKELTMNINSMTNNMGIMIATLCAMGISNFWLT